MARSLKRILTKLRSNREALSWTERRELAASLPDALSDGSTAATALALVDLLSKDPKPEVRKEVADLLVHVPEDELRKLAARLSQDTSSFVLKAVERAMDRRRKGMQESQRRRRDISHVEAQLGSIEKYHGKLAADRARRMANDQFDTLVGSTIHDIRGILSPLKTGISTLQAHLESGQPDRKLCQQHLDKMADRLAFLERFIDDMRAYSRATPTERRRERIEDVVKEAISLVQDELRHRDYDLDSVMLLVDVPGNITASVARHQVVAAIRHILKNAYEAFVLPPSRRKNRRISIAAAVPDGEHVEIAVHNSGPAIAPEDLQEIKDFKPGTTTKANHGGTGFGLPTAHRYATANGGNLTIDSKRGKGVTVTVILPIEQGEDEQ